MRRIRRPTLSSESLKWLDKQTDRVLGANNPQGMAQDLWRRDTKAVVEAASLLQRAAAAPDRCMYCEHNEGRELDHFWPKDLFPECVFVWENLLWACGPCNRKKSTDFPCDVQGRPLLLNPTDGGDNPRKHLMFSPSTGRYKSLTSRGEMSVRFYDLNGDESVPRRQLPDHRKAAWNSVQALIVMYDRQLAKDDSVGAAIFGAEIRRMPHALVLVSLLAIVDNPDARYAVFDDCLEAIARRPEIREWAAEW